MANKKDFIASGPTKPDVPKSHFDLSYTNNLTANFGKIYPLGTWLMPAGSHFRCDADYGFDLQPLVFPVQTNMRFHVKFYKAPLRILWKNWRNYVSRGGKGYDLPYISRDYNFYQTGSLSDYIGVPSFQSTTSRHVFNSSFTGVNIMYNAHYDQFDEFHFANNFNVLDGLSSEYSDLQSNNYITIAPCSFSLLGTLLSESFTIRTKSNSALDFNSTAGIYLYIIKKIDNLQHYRVEFSVRLNSTNCRVVRSGIINIITVSDSVFSSIPYDIIDDDSYYLGLSGDYASHLFDTKTDYLLNSEHLVVADENNFKVNTNQTLINKYLQPIPLGLSFTYSITNDGQNATHFQSVGGATPKLPLLAFRWRMYEFIYNYFIRNERVTPFMLPDDNNVMQQVFNQYLTNDGDGADTTTPLDFKFAPYEYDLFTTCVKKPTFGDAPLVGVSFNYDMSGDAPTGEFQLIREGESNPESFAVSLDENGRLTGITAYNVDASHPNIHNLEEIINFGISINDLRSVSAYQRFLERMTKAGTKYENIMYEFFGTNPPTGEEFPSYLGGYTDLIRTDKVLNQSMSDNSKLGEYAGNAYLRSKGGKRQIRAYCQEDCYIMAIGWFSVTPTYSQKLDKDFVFTNYLDFVNPQFAAMSPQPVYDYQIAPLEIDPTDDEALHHVFGYNRPFAEAVSRQDECHGLFRSNMQNFIMQRIFAGAPQLNEQFLYMRPEDMSQIFAVTETTDKIFGQIHFDVNATLPIPHMAIPKIV